MPCATSTNTPSICWVPVNMNSRSLLILSLAPMLGASQTLAQAAALALFSLLSLCLHRLCMSPLRPLLQGLQTTLVSVLLAAMLVTCLELSLRAWALEVHAQLGIYPALIALQCVLLEQCFERHRGVAQGLLVVIGLCTVHLLLGLCRELLGSAGLRLAQLTPGALILLGLLLAIFNRVRRKPAPSSRQGSL